MIRRAAVWALVAGTLAAVTAAPATAATFRPDGAELMYATSGNVSAQNPAFSPNGSTLIFTRYTNGYDGSVGGVWQMPANGGTATPVWNENDATNVNGLSSYNTTIDRIAMAVNFNDPNIATVAPSGEASTYKQLTNATGNNGYLEPTIAPNGKKIAFEDDLPSSQTDDRSIGSIDLVSSSGGAVTTLIGGDGSDDRLPVWSPNGQLILFQRRTSPNLDDGCAFHLFTIDPTTKVLTQITGVPGTATAGLDNCDSDASWSPNGQWILDSAAYGGLNEDNIFMVSANGKQLVRVTYDNDNEDGAPAMSPNGQWIYFESHRGNDNTPSQIWRIPTPRMDGSTPVYQPDSPNAAQNPCFSPSGTTLAFTIFHSFYNNGDAGVWTIPLAGGTPTKVFDFTGQDSVNLPGSCWNRDTNRITFASDLNGNIGDEIWTANPNGSDPTRVTNHSSALDWIEPSFSPNGQWIVFESDQSNSRSDDGLVGSIELVRANGRTAPIVLVPGGPDSDNREPNWSPDGTRIVFQRRTELNGGNYSLYTTAPNGTGLTRVTDTGSDDTDPSWSPNGRVAVYSSDYNPRNPSNPLNSSNLFTIPASGGTPTRITNQLYYDGAPSWSPFGGWIAFETGTVDPATGDPQLSSIWKIPAPSLAPLGPAVASGYVLADQPSTGSYTPALIQQYNSTGAANTVTRSATGTYTVEFPGLGAAAGGTVAVSAYGASPVGGSCGAAGWSRSGTALVLEVDCHTAAGAAADEPFTASYTRATGTSATPFAYAWANAPATASYDAADSYNSTGAANTIARTGTGAYTVTLPGLGASAGTVKVTATGAGAQSCEPTAWSASGTAERVQISCFASGGAAADAAFALTYAGSVSVLGDGWRATAYALANEPTAASYTPASQYTVGAPITVTRLGTGHYMLNLGADYAGSGGDVQLSATGTRAAGCAVLGWGGATLDQTVDVQCYGPAGAPADEPFALAYHG